MTTKEIGDFGEAAACEYLEKKGISILKRNYRERGGEIDIIAKDGATIVFAEVKTRATKAFGTPGEFVDFRKQEKILKTAIGYLGTDSLNMRFDVIEIMYRLVGGTPLVTEINHIKDAF